MINRQLLSLAAAAWELIARNVMVGLAITATYAGQGFATAAILSDGIRGHGLGSVLPPVGVIVLLLAIRAVLTWLREVVGTLIGGEVKRVVRERLYRRLLALGPGYTAGTRTDHAQAAIVDAVKALEKYYRRVLPQFASDGDRRVLPQFASDGDRRLRAGGVRDPAWTRWWARLVICGAVLVLGSLIRSRLIMRPAMSRWFAQYPSSSSESLDAVQGMTTLKAFNAHERRARDLHEEGARFANASIGMMIASNLPSTAWSGWRRARGSRCRLGCTQNRPQPLLGSADELLVGPLGRSCRRQSERDRS
ncbi:MAG: hypothetical protein ACR2LV_09250 [Solirubrobacteraceae bacterium]